MIFFESNFDHVDLNGAVFKNCNLGYSSFKNADVSQAVFIACNLLHSDFTKANVEDVKFLHCLMNGAVGLDKVPIHCPEKGGFIGWKKGVVIRDETVIDHVIIELYIPASAKRSSASGTKCRASIAKVLSITSIADGSTKYDWCQSLFAPNTIYTVGSYVKPDAFDKNRWNECSHGIHFFMSKQEAIDY